MKILSPHRSRFFRLVIACFFVVGLYGCSSSAGSASGESTAENEGCQKPNSFGKQNLDAVLGGSYRMCENLTEANDILRKMNVILEYPRGPIGWAEDEFKKQVNNVKRDPTELLHDRIFESIPAITRLLPQLVDAVSQVPKIASAIPGALSEAQTLGMFDIPKAVSGVNDAKTNLMRVGQEFPRVIDGMKQAQAGLLSVLSKIQNGESLNSPMFASTARGTDRSPSDAEYAAQGKTFAPADNGALPGVEAQMSREIDGLKTENRTLHAQISTAAEKNKIVLAKLSDLESAHEASRTMPVKISAAPTKATVLHIGQYKKNVELARKNELQACIAGMQSLLDAGIGVDYAGHCYYWIGLCRYSLHEYASSIEQFNKVLLLSASPKKEAAHLMLGKSLKKSGDAASSLAEFKTLIREFPQSQYAGEAKMYLKRL